PTGGGKQVSCPICLEKLSWDDLPLYRYDLDLDRYVELTIPEDASEEHQAREMRTAAVRCPNPGAQVHFLPAAYGQFGPPAVYGFIGATRSGKTHVLASMVAAIERGDLSRYGLAARPIDLNRHQRFLRESVRPLSSGGRQLAATSEGVVSFVDGFLISGAGPERPVALFDVAGEELGDVDNAKHFLDLADGLIFVVDPTQIGRDSLGDRTFSTVLNLLRASGRLSKVSAAIVLNKADLVRFEEPIAYWLRHDDDRLDAAASLRESADVYAYLHQKGAAAWTRPYQECPRVTLHVASATGSSSSEKATTGLHSFERGVQSRRVLRPLVSLMAMTGIIIDDEARKVGI
ncbi:MAG: hypothetical protein ABIS86_05855, partial [Streptosporangiaceae bacterium]